MQKISIESVISPILGQAQPGPGSSLPGLLVIGLMFAAMWFLLIAPQRKKQKELQKMISELKTGDEVLTAGGIHGIIANVKDDRFVVKVADNTKIEVSKSFIQSVVKKDA